MHRLRRCPGGVLRVPPPHQAEMGICWQLSVGMKPVRSCRTAGTGAKPSPPDVGIDANSSPPEVPRKAAGSQLVPWSRKDSPFLSFSTPFNPELIGHNKVLQPCTCLRPPLKPTDHSWGAAVCRDTQDKAGSQSPAPQCALVTLYHLLSYAMHSTKLCPQGDGAYLTASLHPTFPPSSCLLQWPVSL